MSRLRQLPVPILSAIVAAKLKYEIETKCTALKQCVEAARQADTSIADWALRITSQNGEDGIIATILDKIGGGRGKFVEFGYGYAQNNMIAHALISGATGLFIDGDAKTCAVSRAMSSILQRQDLRFHNAWITKDNIDAIITAEIGTGDIDVLSVDVDGNDYWLLQSITSVTPALLITEYNASFGVDRAVTVPYEVDFDRTKKHPSWTYYGASLSALTKLANSRGFALVGCEPSEPNAFFVRRDLLKNGLKERSVADAYSPSSSLVARGMGAAAMNDTLFSLPLVEV